MSVVRTAFVAVTLAAASALFLRTDPVEIDGTDGLASITVPPGFRVELAARPGLVRYPMLGTLDDRGRLFMCESSGKTVRTPEMTADPRYVVSMLEDTNHDGVYDKSTQFADRLTLPAGAAWYRGSLYVAAPPTLWRFQDTDNDGVADIKEIVVTGWNLSANAASLHGPILGPDGYLYLTDGRHGFKIETKDGRRYEGRASRIWRVKPDGTGLDWFAGGGFDNPVEVVFTEAGEMIGTMTYFTDPRDGQRDALLHFVEGGVYPKPHPAMEEFKRTGDLMPVMTKFARIAPAGLMRYEGTAFGPEYRGSLFSAHFNAHRVQRHVLKRTGATFETTDTDFFVSTDPDLHPTDAIEDADGSMLVVDTGAWFIHGCPLSRTAKPNIRGALYRVRRNDAKVPADPRGGTLSFAAMHTEQLARMLEDPRPAVVERASDRLVDAAGSVVEALADYRVHTASLEAACRSIFVLARIATPQALAKITAALSDPRPEVRIAAARAVGLAKHAPALDRLADMLRRDTPPARRQAATALGQIGDPRAAPALLAAAANAGDRFVEHAIIYSLIQLRPAPALLPALTNASPSIRKAALIALDQMDASPLGEQQVLPFLTHTDPALRRTGLWIASRHPAWSPALAKAIESRLRAPEFPSAESEMMREALTGLGAGSEIRRVIAAALVDKALPAERRFIVLRAVAGSAWKQWPEEWTPGLRNSLQHADRDVRLEAIRTARARGIDAVDDEIRRLASSTSEPDDVRIAALSALGARHPQLDDTSFRYLLTQLAPRIEAPVKLAAAQVLSRARCTEDQLREIARSHIRAADPLVLPNLLDAFRNTRDQTTGLDLFHALASVESSLGTVGSQRVRELVPRFPVRVQDFARSLLARIDAGRRTRLEKLRRLEPALHASGDIRKGREIFFGAKAGCSSCHTIGSTGGHVGPDLTSIGAIRSPHDLLEAIVLPSESFVPGHEVYRVETAREVYSGVLKSRNDEAVLLIAGPDDEVRVPRKDIVKMGHAPVSLMPEGFDELLTIDEMSNLLAFLRSQISRQAAVEIASAGGGQ